MTNHKVPVSRNPALDLLRGIAILVVVFHHCEAFTIPGLPELSGAAGFGFWHFRLFGASGVDLFFVLSGFLVGGLLIHEITKYGTIQVGRFLLRRGFKIWPSYFVLLAVLAITQVDHWPDLSSIGATLKSLGIHVFFLQNYLDQTHNTPTWTLAIEEHFYLMLPLLLLVLIKYSKLSRIGLVTAVAMLLCLGFRLLHLKFHHEDNDFMLTHNRVDALLFGVFLAWLWKRFPERVLAFTSHWKLIIPIALLLISPSFFFARKSTFLFSIGFPLTTIGYGLILITLVTQGVGGFENTLLGKGIRKVGLWSYNIYLWHFFLPLLLAPAYRPAQLWLSTLVGNPVVTMALQVTLYTALSVFFGWFFTRFLEEPFLKLREKMVSSRTATVSSR